MNSMNRRLQLNLVPSLFFLLYIYEMRSAITHIRTLGDIQELVMASGADENHLTRPFASDEETCGSQAVGT